MEQTPIAMISFLFKASVRCPSAPNMTTIYEQDCMKEQQCLQTINQRLALNLLKNKQV